MTKQKQSHLIIRLSLIAIAMVGGISAYFATVDRAHNTITTAGVSIELIETAIDNSGHIVPFENISNAIPGHTYSKRPQVINTDATPAWIRLKLTTTVEKSGSPLSVPENALTVDIDTQNWQKSDEYYYYSRVLNTNETTPPLFTEVKFADDLPDTYQGATFSLTVTAEAVQSTNNGSNPLTAGGWNE